MACKGLGLRRLVVLSEVPVRTRYWICYVKLAKGTNTPFQIGSKVVDDLMLGLDESLVKSKTSHCSFCGHPNIKRAHLKPTCEYCGTSNIQGLLKKARGF
ncbi:hypothetical protein NC651_006441 [Populus alba x Populus x berolinensis]|nr:hypothetical protein NC651_006441 [Populus alba x Populus x berolinensis]